MKPDTTAADEAGNPPSAALPEAAVAFLNAFHQWALRLSVDDAKELIPILQTLRAAHVEERHVSRTS